MGKLIFSTCWTCGFSCGILTFEFLPNPKTIIEQEPMDIEKKTLNNISLEEREELLNRLCQHLNRDCHTLTMAAQIVSAKYAKFSWLSAGDLLKAFENDKEFRAKIEPELAIGRQIMADMAEETLLGKLRQGDARSAELVLKTLGSSRGYSEKTEINHNVNQVNEMSSIEAARRLAFLFARAQNEGVVIDNIPQQFLTKQ